MSNQIQSLTADNQNLERQIVQLKDQERQSKSDLDANKSAMEGLKSELTTIKATYDQAKSALLIVQNDKVNLEQ